MDEWWEYGSGERMGGEGGDDGRSGGRMVGIVVG